MGVFLLSLTLSYFTVKASRTLKIIDVPNSRSNHKHSTPTAGGLAIVLTVTIFMLFYKGLSPETKILPFLTSLWIIASVSLVDDLKSLQVLPRVIFQFTSMITLLSYYMPGYLFLCIPLFFFINFYNFMDGIDGSAVSEASHISFSFFIISFLVPELPESMRILSVVLFGASLGFAKFNWHPAKIFLGDVGSISLGLICGWLLLNLAMEGLYAASLIIPMFYLADSSLTILKRLIQRKKIWEAHSEHFFQKAARKGHSHSRITKKIIACNLVLMGLAVASITYPILSFLTATTIVSFLLYNLQRDSY
ncbi:glycosyltransferase family 4 protein [bacterium]|nr:glycosyltransferase family 4 protein [bacterium]